MSVDDTKEHYQNNRQTRIVKVYIGNACWCIRVTVLLLSSFLYATASLVSSIGPREIDQKAYIVM